MYSRYVALGDSFTEGVGDPDPTRPNGLRGWADRVAEVLATQAPAGADGFGYANLAIRGRKLRQVLDEQLGPALALRPDLVTIHAGANDVLRPRVDLDDLAAAYDEAIGRLVTSGAHVLMFTIFDPGAAGLYSALRGRMAVFNEFAREISERHGTSLVDMWRMRERGTPSAMTALMDTDRMHLNRFGHQRIARAVLDALRTGHTWEPEPPPPLVPTTGRERLRADLVWTREFLVPWVHRRLTGRSSGDTVEPKRPALAPIGHRAEVR